jgi:putative membrane protein
MVLILIKLLINALAIFITAELIPGVQLDGMYGALIVALVLGLINAIIKPILMLLTLPINFMTLGLFTFVVNAAMILLASKIVDNFAIPSFWTALVFSIILSVVSSILTWIAK